MSTRRVFVRRFIAVAGAASIATGLGLNRAPSAHATTAPCAGPFKTEGPNLLAVDYTHGRIGSYTLEVTGPEHRVLTITNTAPDHAIHIQFNGLPRGSYFGNVTAPAGCTSIYNTLFNVSGK
jgi:hypothetical protein